MHTKSKWILLTLLIAIPLIVAYNLFVAEYKTDKINRYLTITPHPHTDKMQANHSVDVVLFGDSRAAYWKNFYLSGCTTVNLGLQGDVTPNLMHRLTEEVLPLHPRYSIVFAGINDIVTASLIENSDQKEEIINETISNFESIKNHFTQAGITAIIFLITPPYNPDILRKVVWGRSININTHRVNEAIESLKSKFVIIVNTEEIFKQSGKDWISNIRKDALHYTNNGYNILLDNIRKSGLITCHKGEKNES